MKEMNIDYLCLAPHKGLFAPMGTGILIARKPINNTIIENDNVSFKQIGNKFLETFRKDIKYLLSKSLFQISQNAGPTRLTPS